MSLRVSSPKAPGLLSISFNQDATCLCVADYQGVRIFNLESHQQVFSLEIGAISVAEMLFCTSLLAFVGAGEQPSLSPRKLTLYNTHNASVIQNLSFPSSVLALLLNRKRIVAVLERRAFVYNLETLELLGTMDTPANPKAVAALTPCSEPSLLALPAASSSSGCTGAIWVYDTLQQGAEVLCDIPAHKSPLGLLSWDAEGSLLASASQKGTVIRVHAMPSAATTHSLRRGTKAAAICSMAFGPASQQPRLLCVASDHGTVHIFRLQQPERHPAAAAAASLLSAVLPSSMAQVVEPARPLLTLRLPVQGVPSICAVQPPAGQDVPGGEASDDNGGSSGSFTLSVASCDGVLYSYSVEGVAGAGPGRYFLQGEWPVARAGGGR